MNDIDIHQTDMSNTILDYSVMKDVLLVSTNVNNISIKRSVFTS